MTKIIYEVSSDTANIREHYDTLSAAISGANGLIRFDNCCWDVSAHQITAEPLSHNRIIYLCYALIRANGEIRVVYRGDGRGLCDYDAIDYLDHLEHDTPLPDGYTPWADCKLLILGG